METHGPINTTLAFGVISLMYFPNVAIGDKLEEIFSTNSFLPKTDDAIKLDDLIEMKNHFRLFDYMLDNIDTKLSKSNIIEMNKILKRGTSDEDNPRYNVGALK